MKKEPELKEIFRRIREIRLKYKDKYNEKTYNMMLDDLNELFRNTNFQVDHLSENKLKISRILRTHKEIHNIIYND